MRGEFVDLGGARLYYYAAGTRGAGEPVVFLHGFPTSGHLWGEVVEQMPAGHRLVVADLLGYGRSDPPSGRELSLRAHAERVVQLLDELRIDRACVVGHDLGGGIAQVMALDWPDRVSRMALVNGIGFSGWLTRDARIARFLLPLLRLLPSRLLLPIARAELERGYADPVRAAHSIDRYQRPYASDAGRDVLLEQLHALDTAETAALGARLGELAIPVTVIAGAHDPFVPAALARRIAAAIPNATCHMLGEGRHFLPEEAPRAVAERIQELLER
ncbi:MAG: alpha/beta hydrolase [Gemmatimonadaceae bacterium]|nr:alpha/beta hydrolase [Gemmatimonadaceae bacterium]